MPSIIRSVSLSEQEWEFIQEYELSPTDLIRNKIQEMFAFKRKMHSDVLQAKDALIEKQGAMLLQLNNEVLKLQDEITKLKGGS